MTEPSDIAADVAAAAAGIREMQAGLEAQAPARAVSLDGVTFTFSAPVAMLLPVGGYLTLETPDGPALGQVRELAIEVVDGPEISLNDSGLAAGASARVRFRRIAGAGAMLDPITPFHDAAISEAGPEAIGSWLDAHRPRTAPLALGSAMLAPTVPIELDARGFSRHSFLCGQSGSGKSYTTGLLLEQLLLQTDLPIVVLDPNSDATRLGEALPGLDAQRAARWAQVAPRIAVRRVGGEGDERLRLRFFDLDPAVQQALVGLDPIADREEYDALRQLLEAEAAGSDLDELTDRLRAVDDPQIRQLGLRIANLGILDWPIWSGDRADPGLLGELDTLEHRCLVVDLGSVPSRTQRSLVAAAVLARLWARRTDRRPVLLVIDEAHNICPPDAADPLTAVATERAVDIAAEGRKFGLHLLVATQRPLKVHENVLSQCDNLVLMRMNAAGDLARLAELFSFVPPGLLARASNFGLGQALVAGRVVSHPTLVSMGTRVAQEGGADVPTTWARPRSG